MAAIAIALAFGTRSGCKAEACASQSGSNSVASLKSIRVAVPTPAEAASGALLERRYRLDEVLSEAEGTRLWRGADTLVGELPVAIRAWWGLTDEELAALQQRLERLKAVLHPQIPRLGEQLPAEGGCWQVRECCLLYTSPSPRDRG